MDGDAGGSAMDAFMCVHSRDIDGLFTLALGSLQHNFQALGSLHLVSNDPDALRAALDRMGVDRAVVTADDAWLSTRERALPGWYRQQIIKLRAYEFCQTAQFVNLGADTVLLRAVGVGDLVAGGEPILTWTRHRPRDRHWLYERFRVHYVARLLGTRPRVAARHVDFINDFFCFDRTDLMNLDALLRRRHGPDSYATVLEPLAGIASKEKHFGEWTLYCTYVLDVLGRHPTLRVAGDGFIEQVRSPTALEAFGFHARVAHFVDKQIDPAAVRRGVARIGNAWADDPRASDSAAADA